MLNNASQANKLWKKKKINFLKLSTRYNCCVHRKVFMFVSIFNTAEKVLWLKWHWLMQLNRLKVVIKVKFDVIAPRMKSLNIISPPYSVWGKKRRVIIVCCDCFYAYSQKHLLCFNSMTHPAISYYPIYQSTLWTGCNFFSSTHSSVSVIWYVIKEPILMLLYYMSGLCLLVVLFHMRPTVIAATNMHTSSVKHTSCSPHISWRIHGASPMFGVVQQVLVMVFEIMWNISCGHIFLLENPNYPSKVNKHVWMYVIC